MEIREERVDDAEPESRIDEQVGPPARREDAARAVGGAFERADDRRADRDDPPASRTRLGDGASGFGRDLVALGGDRVVLDLLRPDGKEGPGADVKRRPRHADAAPHEPIEQRAREVEPCGRCRDRAVSFREDGLIAGRVLGSSFGIAVSVDVGRKRNAPRCGERRAEIAPLCGVEGDPVHLARAGAEVANLERRPHIDPRAGRRRPGEARQAEPRLLSGFRSIRTGAGRPFRAGVRRGATSARGFGQSTFPRGHSCKGLDEEDLDLASGLLPSDEPRRDHACVVQDKEVARSEETVEVAEGCVLDARCRRRGSRPALRLCRGLLAPAEHHEPRAVALGRRVLRDPVGGKLVVEIGEPHRSRLR